MARLSKPIYFTNLFYESIFGFRKRRVALYYKERYSQESQNSESSSFIND